MEEKEIKKIIGHLKFCVDVWNFKVKKADSYIKRLENHLKTDFKECEYEGIMKRDKCLLEKIASFMEFTKN